MTRATVLFVHHAVEQTGVKWIRGSTRCLLDLLTHLDRKRFAPVVWCNAPVIDLIAETGAKVELARDWAVTGRRFSPSWMWQTRNLIRRYGVELIHADEYMQAAALVPVARLRRVPLIAQLHRIPTLAERRWSLLHQVDLAVGSSRSCLPDLIADGFPAERTAVIYNGVNQTRLATGDARQLRQQLGIPNDEIVFTMAAYFVAWKAIDVALAAFQRLRHTRGRGHLLLCGDGPERAQLEERVASLGIMPWTHFLGDRRDVGAVFRDATNVMLTTSREESFGLTLAEAGTFGIPVIASRIPAHCEVLDGNGLLVPVDDVAGFADAMSIMLDDAARRAELGEQLRRRVAAMFTTDRYARQFEDVYARLLAAPSSAYGWRATRWPRTYTEWVSERLIASPKRPSTS